VEVVVVVVAKNIQNCKDTCSDKVNALEVLVVVVVVCA
jgi:hypothetical protein